MAFQKRTLTLITCAVFVISCLRKQDAASVANQSVSGAQDTTVFPILSCKQTEGLEGNYLTGMPVYLVDFEVPAEKAPLQIGTRIYFFEEGDSKTFHQIFSKDKLTVQSENSAASPRCFEGRSRCYSAKMAKRLWNAMCQELGKSTEWSSKIMLSTLSQPEIVQQ